MRALGFILFLFALAGCASKPVARVKTGGSLAGVPAEAVASATGDASDVPAKFYYADVEILSETVVEGPCPDSQKYTERVEAPPRVILSEQNELELSSAKDMWRLFSANVTFHMIGFDSAHYSFTAIDGVAPKTLPVSIRLRRIPGNILQLYYLDQEIKMKLKETPIYTFTAKETRGTCTVVHNVNVFGERVGYYPLKSYSASQD